MKITYDTKNISPFHIEIKTKKEEEKFYTNKFPLFNDNNEK